MHIRFLGGGTGSARAAADYLVGERDSAGLVRPGVEVLRGNPDQVADVADSLEFGRRYSSAVIAWAPEDRPSDAQIGAVLDEFEKTAWAGLEPDRYAWTAVLHREHGTGVHVHVLSARCDLETGRSLNIAPPAGKRPSARCATPSTTSTAGAAPTIRRAPGRTSRAIAPTWRPGGCGPVSSTKPDRAS